MSYTSSAWLSERETKAPYMNQPLGELHPWDRCNPVPVADVCGPSSQTLKSDASDGQLCAAHTSVLMQGRESNAKSFLPGIFHTTLFTSAYTSQWGIRVTCTNLEQDCFLTSQTLMCGEPFSLSFL